MGGSSGGSDIGVGGYSAVEALLGEGGFLISFSTGRGTNG